LVVILLTLKVEGIMADRGLYLIDVTIRPCAYVNDVITGSWASLKEGSKAGGGKVIYGFKVS